MQRVNKTRGIGPLGSSGLIAQWGASSLIASVQYVSIAVAGTSATATISSVDTSRAVVVHLGEGSPHNTGNSTSTSFLTLVLTNATTVTASRFDASGFTVTATGVVIEFMPGVLRSLQQYTVSVASATSGTATISTVTPEKTFLLPRGMNNNDTAGGSASWAQNLTGQRTTLTNSTTVTSTRNTSGTITNTVAGTAVEFF